MDPAIDFTTKMTFQMVRTYDNGGLHEVTQEVGNDAEYLGDVFDAFAEFLNASGFSYLSYKAEKTEEGWLIPFMS